jgi:excisionase family DNA binding protein
MSSVALALVNDLGPDDLAVLADRLAPYLVSPPPPTEDGWLDSQRAASYLGISRNALYKLTAARSIPFEQEQRGCKCWFRRSDLDAWRTVRGHHKVAPRRANVRGRDPRRGTLHE